MPLTKEYVMIEPRYRNHRETTVVWHFDNFFMASLAAEVYNQPLLRLSLPHALQASHKLELPN